MFFPCLPGFVLQQSMQKVRWIVVCPNMSALWWNGEVFPRRSPTVSWDRLQPPRDPEKDTDNGWMDGWIKQDCRALTEVCTLLIAFSFNRLWLWYNSRLLGIKKRNICSGLYQTNGFFHDWRRIFVGQDIHAALQYFIIMLFYQTFYFYQKLFMVVLQFHSQFDYLCSVRNG